MSFIRSCISRSVFLLGAGVAVAAQAEVRIDGPIEYGVFESRYQDFQPGERVLTRSEQNIQQTTEVRPSSAPSSACVINSAASRKAIRL